MNSVPPIPGSQPSIPREYIILIVVGLGLLAILAYTDLYNRIRSLFLPVLPIIPPNYKPDATTNPPKSSLLPYDNTKNQTWCFVGEDNTGRYCVKVPATDLCEPIRTFGSRESCELVEGSQMPLALVTQKGHSVTPISSLNIAESAASALPFVKKP
jgi:hypothetical protein